MTGTTQRINRVYACFLLFLTFHAFQFQFPARSDETTDLYIEMQQREECESLGGRIDGNKCYLPERGAAGDVAPIFVKNPYDCRVWVLVAYVKPGGQTYTVDGWWEIGPTYWSGIRLEDNDAPLLHDGSYPLYFHLVNEDGKQISKVSTPQKFSFENEAFDVEESEWGMIDGGYWIGVEKC
jgi:hypothetical protein